MKKISSETMHYVDDLRREINKLYAAPLSVFRNPVIDSTENDKKTAETDN